MIAAARKRQCPCAEQNPAYRLARHFLDSQIVSVVFDFFLYLLSLPSMHWINADQFALEIRAKQKITLTRISHGIVCFLRTPISRLAFCHAPIRRLRSQACPNAIHANRAL